MTKEFYQDSNTGPEWTTPKYIWKPLFDSLGGFDLDPASGCEPEPIAGVRYTIKEDGLTLPWFGDVWVNPPYGREFNSKWSEKIHKESHRKRVNTITALIPASTSTNWFHDNYWNAKYLTFIDHRVSFKGGSDGNASFASVIASFGDDFPQDYIDELHELGMVMK